MQSDAIQIFRHGGPETLEHHRVELPQPRSGELLIRQTAIGVNFADIYQRRGQSGPHTTSSFPITLGASGAGIVEQVGADVTQFATGDLIGFVSAGAYSKWTVIRESRAVRLPAGFSAELAAATLLRGMTAQYLLQRLFPVKPGSIILVHAAAGGMGTLLSQWGKALGAFVIGTVGSPGKTVIARANGCDEVINYAQEDFVALTKDMTRQQGVDVVYDAVGHDVFLRSLDCLRPMGMAINYGAASGPVGAFDLQRLHHKSLIVSRPTLSTYIATHELLTASAAAFFSAIADGSVQLEVKHRYAWTDVRRAHEDLENRRTSGAIALIP